MKILWNTEKIGQLMRQLTTVSSIAVSFYDANRQPLYEKPYKICPFCENMHKCSAFYDGCLKSNERAFSVVERTGESYLYRCHAGLVEMAAPVIAGGDLVGYIMIGQFAAKEDAGSLWQNVRDACAACGAPCPQKEELFRQVQFLSRDEILAWCEIVQACANYLWTSQYFTAMNDRGFQQTEQYIQEHLSAPVSAKEICAATGIPRNRLYKIVRSNTGMTVGDYIWRMRIERAQQLLSNTNLPVSEIAAAVGVEDYGYFTKVFRRISGMTPSAYRREHSL